MAEPAPRTPAAARAAIEDARRRVMDLYDGNLDHPALDHLEAALCAVDEVERDRALAALARGRAKTERWLARRRKAALTGSTPEADR